MPVARAADQLLCVWAIVPLALVTLAPVKNAHYAISAQVPWSIWAALAMARLGKLMVFRGYDSQLLLRRTQTGFAILALAYGFGIWLLSPYLDHRGREWAFYERASRQIPADMPLVLLYDDWDRNPYETPFGLIPHDLAVRLFYLGRSASWHIASETILAKTRAAGKDSAIMSPLLANKSWSTPVAKPIAVIGRQRDLPILRQLGQIEIVAHGPNVRPTVSIIYFGLCPGWLALLQTVKFQLDRLTNTAPFKISRHLPCLGEEHREVVRSINWLRREAGAFIVRGSGL